MINFHFLIYENYFKIDKRINTRKSKQLSLLGLILIIEVFLILILKFKFSSRTSHRQRLGHQQFLLRKKGTI